MFLSLISGVVFWQWKWAFIDSVQVLSVEKMRSLCFGTRTRDSSVYNSESTKSLTPGEGGSCKAEKPSNPQIRRGNCR
jgi:hypothetical protein